MGKYRVLPDTYFKLGGCDGIILPDLPIDSRLSEIYFEKFCTNKITVLHRSTTQ